MRSDPSRRARRVAFVLGGAMLTACGGRSPDVQPPAKALCEIETTLNGAAPLAERSFPAQYWFLLMLRGYRSSGEVAAPLRDCRGLPVEVRHDGCSPEPVGQTDEAARLTPADLLISTLGDARRLVWITTSHLPDGQAQGPVALAEVTSRGVAVRAMGVLRAYPERAKLRLLQLGGKSILVAEGEHCPGKLDPTSCDRAIRVMPLVADRFQGQPLARADGQCSGSSLIAVHSGGRVSAGTSYEFESAVRFLPDAISIDEQLTIRPAPTKRERETGDAFITKVQAARRLTFRGDQLIASDGALLGKWLANRESTSSAAAEP